MASGCLYLFFADQILDKLLSLEEDGQLISRGLKHELGEVKKVVSAVRAALLYAEGSGLPNKGVEDWVYIDNLENDFCWVDLLVNELFCWVRERKRERERSVVVMPMLRRNLRNTTFTNLFLTNSPMKPFQKEIQYGQERLEDNAGWVFGANISDRIKSGETADSYFGGDTEGETSSGKNKDEVIQSLIPPFGRPEELLKSIGRRLLFENDDDDPDDIAINTLTNIFYFKYISFFNWAYELDVNIIFPERVLNDLSTRLMQRYALLPLPLKYCFDYCSLFPRDYIIEVPLLLKLWMAQGFAVDEDWGRCYFQYLFNAGFFEPVESDVLETTKCRMDSRTFALSAFTSGPRYLLLRSDGRNYIRRAFHVSLDFHLYSERQIQKLIARSPKLIHSFLLPCQMKSKSDRGMIDAEKIRNIVSPDPDVGWKHEEEIKPESVSDLLISNLEALRALELHDLGIQRLPDNIGGRLKHLRYLDVSRNPDIKLLPNSITKLVYLQTLKLSSCFGLQELPKDMKNLINLRHLEIDGCHNLRRMPPELGQLTNLRTLSKYVLNNKKDPRGLEELGKLNNLRGELQIKNLSASFGNACHSARLEDKQHLQSLELEWSSSSPTSDQLEDLKPHMNLKRLTLRGYGGLRLSSWLQSLTSLCILVLDNMPNLEYISNEGGGLPMAFPSLRELWLTELPQLKGLWKDEVELQSLPSFPCLSKLFIQDCPKLDSIPLFPTLEEELMLDSTSLKPFQRMLTMEKTQKSQAPPPLSKLKNLSFVGIKELDDSTADGIPWKTLTSLRVLKLDFLTNLEELPSNLQHLTNLKELHIRRCKMRALPEWIKDLQSLEKLAIWVCPYMKSLPEGIRSLTSLKNLEIEDCPTLLQRCQKETGADWDKIEHIPNLSGQLSAGKKESLVLKWSSSSPTNDQYQLEDLKPHKNLKRLTLRGYGGLRLSSWLQSLTSLCILELDNMPNLEYISNEGGGLPMVFPSLRELWLKKLPQLKQWWNDDVKLQSLPSFHCLSKLIIQDCPKLVSIPLFPTLEEGDGLPMVFPSLRELWLKKLPQLKQWWNDDVKLQSLPSFHCLSKLIIQDCPKLVSIPLFPTLEEGDGLPMVFPSLRELWLKKLPQLKQWWNDDVKLQSLPSFHCLSKLIIQDCPKLVSIPLFPTLEEGDGLPMVFPSLRELWLKKLPQLKQWWNDDVKLQSLPSFHCLSKLIIQDCPKLVSIPLFPTLEEGDGLPMVFPSLRELWLKKLPQLKQWWNDDVKLQSLPSFHCLSKLIIQDCPKLVSIPLFPTLEEGDGLPMVFPSLRELWLKKLPQLKQWWNDDVKLQSLPSFHCLSKLIIQDCPKLVSIPHFPTLEEELMLDTTSLKPFQRTLMMENTQKSHVSPPLSKLQNLSFVGIKELDVATADGIPWETLTSLRVLKLDFLTNLEELPSNLRHLTNLKELHIRRCKMTALPEWIRHLRSLEKLAIRSCPSMESLFGQPEGIRNLYYAITLKTLEIEDCPTLLQRCQKETGADWDKIKYIPNLSGQLSAGKKRAKRGRLAWRICNQFSPVPRKYKGLFSNIITI